MQIADYGGNMSFWTVIVAVAALMWISSAQDNLTCIENPTGEVSLNVAVRGVSGPEGPQGFKGEVGPLGVKGEKGLRGLRGHTGDSGDIGGVGKTGPKGEIGTKGQKGSRGIQGIPGPVGFPGLVGPRGSRGYPGFEGPIGPEGPNGSPGLVGPKGSRGHPGVEGPIGPTGPGGLPGPRGPQGEDGDTVLSDREFNRATQQVHESVLAQVRPGNEYVNITLENAIKTIANLRSTVEELNKTLLGNIIPDLQAIRKQYTVKCGILGAWRRVAYFNTRNNDPCPSVLQTVTTNAAPGQKACGRRSTSLGCDLWRVASRGQYTNVCGTARAYQYFVTVAFNLYFNSERTLNSAYVDGISITSGNFGRHIWTFAAGATSNYVNIARCPCAIQPPRISSPPFVGNNYFCESGFTNNIQKRVSWEDALWDGHGCTGDEHSACCQRSGWFHRELPPSSDDLEIRWCGHHAAASITDIPTDLLEIWVM